MEGERVVERGSGGEREWWRVRRRGGGWGVVEGGGNGGQLWGVMEGGEQWRDRSNGGRGAMEGGAMMEGGGMMEGEGGGWCGGGRGSTGAHSPGLVITFISSSSVGGHCV